MNGSQHTGYHDRNGKSQNATKSVAKQQLSVTMACRTHRSVRPRLPPFHGAPPAIPEAARILCVNTALNWSRFVGW